jgi:hypothetical protein
MHVCACAGNYALYLCVQIGFSCLFVLLNIIKCVKDQCRSVTSPHAAPPRAGQNTSQAKLRLVRVWILNPFPHGVGHIGHALL